MTNGKIYYVLPICNFKENRSCNQETTDKVYNFCDGFSIDWTGLMCTYRPCCTGIIHKYDIRRGNINHFRAFMTDLSLNESKIIEPVIGLIANNKAKYFVCGKHHQRRRIPIEYVKILYNYFDTYFERLDINENPSKTTTTLDSILDLQSRPVLVPARLKKKIPEYKITFPSATPELMTVKKKSITPSVINKTSETNNNSNKEPIDNSKIIPTCNMKYCQGASKPLHATIKRETSVDSSYNHHYNTTLEDNDDLAEIQTTAKFTKSGEWKIQIKIPKNNIN